MTETLSTGEILGTMRSNDSDFDAVTDVAFFKGTARQLYRFLGLTEFNWRKLKGPSRYKDSGLWSSYRNDLGQMTIHIDVGCFCEHDCCGHLCRLSHTIIPVSWGRFVIITSKGFNY